MQEEIPRVVPIIPSNGIVSIFFAIASFNANRTQGNEVQMRILGILCGNNCWSIAALNEDFTVMHLRGLHLDFVC